MAWQLAGVKFFHWALCSGLMVNLVVLRVVFSSKASGESARLFTADGAIVTWPVSPELLVAVGGLGCLGGFSPCSAVLLHSGTCRFSWGQLHVLLWAFPNMIYLWPEAVVSPRGSWGRWSRPARSCALLGDPGRGCSSAVWAAARSRRTRVQCSGGYSGVLRVVGCLALRGA